jgi:hypothetical protein
LSTSPGVEPIREARTLAAVIILLIAPATASSESGNEAFARQDYAAAVDLWRTEAADGSAEAKFGLGLIYDLGLGVPRHSAAALRWYLEAAGDGFADAQFNAAVMFDTGTGAPRDPAAAATWYARAAANGHARAQYNLAMLYENGIGVPSSHDLARAWYEAAGSTLAAAADRLAQLSPPEEQARRGPPPHPVIGAVVGPLDEPRAELVWTADAGRDGFQVQVARRPAGAAASTPGRDDLVLSQDVERTAVAIDLPVMEAGLLWRVGHIGGAGAAVAWSPWQELSRKAVIDDPLLAAETAPRRLTIYVNAGDNHARIFAEELSGDYSRGGVDVMVKDAARPASATTVEYRYGSDAAFAAAVAAFLPTLGPDSALQASGLGTPPGEVTLRLVGGPRPSEHVGD